MSRHHLPWRARAARAAQALTALASLLALTAMSGCGPGTGGSGDGERALAVFNATTANVCTSGFNTALACPVTGQPGSTVEGTQMVLFSDTQAGNNVSVVITGSQLELSARCQNMRFEGLWGITAQADARFFGTYTAPGQATPAPASLTVQAATPSISNGDVFALLRSQDGRVLLGPLLLQRVPNMVTNPAACPP